MSTLRRDSLISDCVQGGIRLLVFDRVLWKNSLAAMDALNPNFGVIHAGLRQKLPLCALVPQGFDWLHVLDFQVHFFFTFLLLLSGALLG